ncbi:MAG TPA: hypothetical protein VF145_04890 [Chitinophagaceae bacterium]
MKKLYLMLLLLPLVAQAQQDTTEKKNEFSGSINYQSRLHYFGRTDSARSSGLFPLLGYTFKNGIYGQLTAVFVKNPSTPYNYTGGSAEAGYRFEGKKFEGNLFVSKFFYSEESPLVQSALKAQTGLNLSLKNKYVNLNGGVDLKFSDQTDFGVTLGLDHLFAMPIKGWDNSAIAIMPSATLNAGTQRFTNSYIKRGNFLGIPMSQEKTEQVEKFSVLAYEFSAPLVLVSGKFNGYVIPSFVVPQNLMDEEQGEPMFYVTLGLGFRL